MNTSNGTVVVKEMSGNTYTFPNGTVQSIIDAYVKETGEIANLFEAGKETQLLPESDAPNELFAMPVSCTCILIVSSSIQFAETYSSPCIRRCLKYQFCLDNNRLYEFQEKFSTDSSGCCISTACFPIISECDFNQILQENESDNKIIIRLTHSGEIKYNAIYDLHNNISVSDDLFDITIDDKCILSGSCWGGDSYYPSGFVKIDLENIKDYMLANCHERLRQFVELK